MKLAIIGKINSALTYNDWEKIFIHHFCNEKVSEISITGADTILNSYVKTYASKFSIPVAVYTNIVNDAKSKLGRNNLLIKDADFVVAFATTENAKISCVNHAVFSQLPGKNALVIFTDEPIDLK